MQVLMWFAAGLAALVHVLIFCMESLWWTTAPVLRRFRQTPEQAAATRLFAFNQGFYNLFLAAGTIFGLALVQSGRPDAGMLLLYWNCGSMVAAALVLLVSSPAMRRGAFIQGTAPLLFLLLAVIGVA